MHVRVCGACACVRCGWDWRGIEARRGRGPLEFGWLKAGCVAPAMSPSGKPKHPNPFLFVAISGLSFVAFYATLKYRAATHPASAQPRQHDHPLVPPRHKDA